MRHLPNIICVLRIALVWPIAAALAQREYLLALALFMVAGLSDGNRVAFSTDEAAGAAEGAVVASR